MRFSISSAQCKSTTLPELRFDDQKLSSFSGLIVFQQLINELNFKHRLSRCFQHRNGSPSFTTASIVLLLVLSLLLGYRRLRDVQYFQNDPIVLRILGLRRMPTVGQRSYYPLYCTVAQTAQVLAVHHRSGNVHDSNGAQEFITHCVKRPALWQFCKIGTLRKQLIQRAGPLIRPQGVLTLSMSTNSAVEELMRSYLPPEPVCLGCN